MIFIAKILSKLLNDIHITIHVLKKIIPIISFRLFRIDNRNVGHEGWPDDEKLKKMSLAKTP